MPEIYSAGTNPSQPDSTPPPAGGNSLDDLLKKGNIRSKPGGLFSTYLVGPTWVSFDTEEPQENIILLLRPHWVTNVSWVLVAVVMIVAPLVLPFFPILSFLPAKFQLVGVLFWYLLTLAFIFEQFLGWFYNIFVVTDIRVVDIDFVNLIFREISEAELHNIESLTVTQGGIVEGLFDYGQVFIQTAAEIENIEFEQVPNPSGVVKVINLLMPDNKKE